MQPVVSGPETTTTLPSTTSAWIEDAPHEHGSSLRAFGEAAEALTAKTRTIATKAAIQMRDPPLTKIERSSRPFGYGRRSVYLSGQSGVDELSAEHPTPSAKQSHPVPRAAVVPYERVNVPTILANRPERGSQHGGLQSTAEWSRGCQVTLAS